MYECFKKQCLQEGKGFYEPMTKISLKMFGGIKKKVIGSNKEVVLKADRRLFGTMVLIAANRKLDMRSVFSHPLGSLPWSMSNIDGSLKKTNKAILAKHLECMVDPEDAVPSPYAVFIDAMALIQRMHGENHTFEELSDHVFEYVLHAG